MQQKSSDDKQDKQDKPKIMKDDTMPSTSKLVAEASTIWNYSSDEDPSSSLSETESDMPSSQVFLKNSISLIMSEILF